MKLSLLAAFVSLAALSVPAAAGGAHHGPGKPGMRPPMYVAGGVGPAFRPGRPGHPWRRFPGNGFGAGYGGYGPGWWDGSNGDTVVTNYTIPQTQRYEIAPELPVANNIRHAPAGAPVLYVINAPAGAKNARVVESGPMKPMGSPVIGEGGDQTPRIVELYAR